MSSVSQCRIPATAASAPAPASTRWRLPLAPVVVAALLFVAPAFWPAGLWTRALLLIRLSTAAAPTHVASPLDGLVVRDVRDSWGFARANGRRHEGIDLFTARGTTVRATTEGIVWRVGSDPLGGLVVWVLGPGRQLHYYAHLSRQADLRPGEAIAAGDRLGEVGTTGNARGGAPHLHYGIYRGGTAINPYPLLVSAPR